MNQLTLEEAMEIRRSIVKPHESIRGANGGYGHISNENFRWLKENYPYETDIIIGYALDLDYKLNNYNREQWRGRMDRDPEKDRRGKEGRTGLLRSVNHHYTEYDCVHVDEKFKAKVNTSFGDVEWYVSYFIPAYRPDRWYRPVWVRVRDITARW